MSAAAACLFCAIATGAEPAQIVYEDESTVAFLDVRPVFHGHVLVVPREHHETLTDIPPALLTRVMATVQMVAAGVEAALDAHGTFVAMNNRVSQSVPHLHVHVVPRRRKDGLRGFFWPRQPYDGPEQMEAVAERIRGTLASGGGAQTPRPCSLYTERRRSAGRSWRGGRVAEGTRLLSEYGANALSRVRIPPSPSDRPGCTGRS